MKLTDTVKIRVSTAAKRECVMNCVLITGRNADFPKFLPPRAFLRGHLACSSEQALHSAAPSSVVSATSPMRAGAAVAPCARSFAQGAPLFDATHDVWIVPPSRTKRDAGAAAALRHPDYKPHRPVAARRAGRSPLARHLLEVLEFLVVLVGLGAAAILAVLLWAVLS